MWALQKIDSKYRYLFLKYSMWLPMALYFSFLHCRRYDYMYIGHTFFFLGDCVVDAS
jgi:hypothetical protein